MITARRVLSSRPFVLGLAVSTLLSSTVSTQVTRGRSVNAGPDASAAVVGEALVKFRTPPSQAERAMLRGQVDADRDEEIGSAGVVRYHSRSLDAAALSAFFGSHPNVEYAEPNYIVQTTASPNDPGFAQLWGLQNVFQVGADIGAVAAWDVSTGSQANVVAVIDTGMDYSHQDLAANVWSAPSSFTVTIGGSSITCAAGTHGFNAILRTCDPMDDNNHGTHTSGTIGPGKRKITLTSSASAGASSYIVSRSTTSAGPYSVVANGITATTYQNTGLSSGGTHFYVVAAKNAAGASGDSNQASATAS
jgi:subtilisin family serine protease